MPTNGERDLIAVEIFYNILFDSWNLLSVCGVEPQHMIFLKFSSFLLVGYFFQTSVLATLEFSIIFIHFFVSRFFFR